MNAFAAGTIVGCILAAFLAIGAPSTPQRSYWTVPLDSLAIGHAGHTHVETRGEVIYVRTEDDGEENRQMMRAKLEVRSVKSYGEPPTSESVEMWAVTGKAPFGAQGESEDNTFARYTPQASFMASINNPALLGKFKVGQKFYVDFTEASE